ncbi:MAG TPA: tetratricopeptide repeat protein [Gemmatimonadales bacterium]|nr:tetratricopeptide repeat protein [Gemmatimonadales bacterium]
MTGYTTEEVARLLGLSPAQIRSYTRSGFLSPARSARGELRFSFQDLVLLKAAKGLMAARVPAVKVRGSLRRLKQQLPRGRALSELRITAEGHRVVARDGAVAWNPESGQLVLDFDVATLAQRAAPLARRQAAAARRVEDEFEADDWFALGLELEVSEPDEARDAYRRALELDPHHADAHVNLGRLLVESDRAEEAETHFRAVVADQPDHATAWFNLGIALEDRRRPNDAVKAYEQAITADRRLADAHFNLARLYEQAGKRAAALRHLSKYRLLTET